MKQRPTREEQRVSSYYRTEISERLRVGRTYERYSQDELAAEIGITRAALGNYESGLRPLPFAVGLRWCQRLNINPGWLVGGGPMEQHPFVSPTELGVSEADLASVASRRISFYEGYGRLLALPLAAWFKTHKPEDLILRSLQGGPAPVARRMGVRQLEIEITNLVERVVKARHHDRLAWISVLRSFLDELETRTKLMGRKSP